MRHILARRQQTQLASFAHSNVIVVWDYDGTLAPIAERPSAARMRRSTFRLLLDVARLYPCAVISGRARADIAARLADVPVLSVAGNHGLEPWENHPHDAADVQRWVTYLQRRLAHWAGVHVEDKRYTVTVHYRRSVNRPRARRAVIDAVTTLRGVRVISGKMTVNLIPKGAPHKGTALEQARRRFACDTAIYVGDDETDEDAFAAASARRLLAIRVGRASSSRASYYLRNQREIDRLLAALVNLRRGHREKG